MGDVIERPASYELLQREARHGYPTEQLPSGGSALCFFSAGFWGWNDVIHLAKAGLQLTCVDTDQHKLWEMAELYPAGSEFRVADAWEFAREHQDSEGWDVVSVDPWTQTIEEALSDLELWCSLSNHLVTIGCFNNKPNPIPDGWQGYVQHRNKDVGWLVLTRT